MRRRGLQGSSNEIKIEFDGELLCFTPESSSRFKFTNDIYYSVDQENWIKLPANTNTPTLNTKVWWYADLTPNSSNGIGTFSSTGKFNVSGNPKCLLQNNELVDYSFYRLFRECYYLLDASALILDSTTLTKYCYYYMFQNCVRLIATPELPAITLASNCYDGMFRDCTSLTVTPELPATTLAYGCYMSMFGYCTSLIQAPELPATTLTQNCYNYMFQGCASLIQAPELPATTLASGCYGFMFDGCTSLTQAPELPATTLASYCYWYMFRGCASLIQAPELPATTLASYCYYYMFYDCIKLNYVKSHATNISAYVCLKSWLGGVSSTGDFYGVEGVSYPTGPNGIPSGWTRHNIYYLTFEVIEDSQFKFTNTLQYSTNQITWNTLSANTYTPVFTSGTKVYWKGALTPTPSKGIGIGTFSSTGKFNVSGNPKELLKDKELVNYNFYDLFKNCYYLLDASLLILDSTTLTGSCYDSMFSGCSSLTQAPELPATVLASACYYNMFSGCSSLTQAPELPATTLTNSCYAGMFNNCISLTQAPKLPATVLANRCYWCMFSGCSSLTQAPELPATTLADYCYASMFSNCTSLTQAPKLPATVLANRCYESMFSGCSSLTQAPELPATTLADYCYYYMFYGCNKLNYVKSHATNISASNCLSNWLYNVSSTGEFHKPADVTYPEGKSGIPSGWNVYEI